MAVKSSSGIERAAALLLGLGVENSSVVLQYLGENELERVMLSMSQIGPIPQEFRKNALEEAYNLSIVNKSQVRGGIEYTRQLLAKTVGPRRGTEILERISAQSQISSFEMLGHADPIQVAQLLGEEHPQTVALVLSYLDAKLAASILTHMPRELQVDITLRLATMDRVSPQVVQTVERSLKHKLSGVINEADFRSTGGVTFLVQMLNQVDRGVQKTIFESLELTNPKLVEEIQANLFTFDNLIRLDDKTIQRILRDVKMQDLALALKGAPEALADLIFRNLSERARENLKEEVDILGPQLAKNVYTAQRRIVDVVRALEAAEEIIISGGGEEYELIS